MIAPPLAYLELIRPHHWLKNVFVLAPLFFSGQLFSLTSILNATAAFAMFCMLASAVYVFNDLHDIEDDRAHKKKRNRPLVSGAVTIREAWTIWFFLLAVSGLIFVTTKLPSVLGLIAALYVGINIFYSISLKHVSLIELFLVSSGFVLRLLGGSVAISIALTNWIVVCTGLVALMLTVGKRRGDIIQVNDSENRRRVLSTYSVWFLDLLLGILAAATIVSYLLFCISDHAARIFGVEVIITAIFVIFGVFRFIQIVVVENGGDSPTVMIANDAVMRYATLAWAATYSLIIYV